MKKPFFKGHQFTFDPKVDISKSTLSKVYKTKFVLWEQRHLS